MAGTKVRLIYIPDGGPKVGEVVEVWKGELTKVHNCIMPFGELNISFSNIFPGDEISYCLSGPFRVDIEEREHGMDIKLFALPDKRCGNCKHSHEGVCENCKGVEGTTEITSNASCENWTAEGA